MDKAMTPGLPYQWQQRCRAAFNAELATGLTSDEIMAFIQPGACCVVKPFKMYRSPGLPPIREWAKRPVAAKWAHIKEFRDEAVPPDDDEVTA